MTRTWIHPGIGTLAHDGCDWVGSIELPNFSVFNFGLPKPGIRNVSIRFESYDRLENAPVVDAIAELTSLLDHASILPTLIRCAIWRVVQTWNWIELCVEDKSIPPPKSEDELGHHMKLIGIAIRQFPEVNGSSTEIDEFTGEITDRINVPRPRPSFWATEFAFRCNFDAEHGLSVLMRGREVLDVGQIGGVWPPDDYTLTSNNILVE